MTTGLVFSLALACAASAQTPAFEAASVKVSESLTPAVVQSGRAQIGITIDALNVRISKLSMFELITLAYQVKGHQVSGPSWMVNERYDIQAKLPEGGKRGQVPAMMQSLLAERFGLQFHRENRAFNVYAMVQAKGGHGLQPAPEDVPAQGAQLRGGIAVGPGGVMNSTGAGGNIRTTPGPGGNRHIESKSVTMAALVNFLNRYCDLPLMDMTDLKGAFEVELDISGEEVRNVAHAHGVNIAPPPGDAPDDPAGVSLRTSLEHLGLKLETRKAPAEVIVVDKIERVPTENQPPQPVRF